MSPIDISPKIGDLVRATCGKSVIVGTVHRLGTSGYCVNIGSCDWAPWLLNKDWTFEVLSWPISEAIGTVALDGSHQAWQCHPTGWRRVGVSTAFPLGYVQSVYGPLTVIWEPMP